MKFNKLIIPIILITLFSCDPKDPIEKETSKLPHFQFTIDVDADEIDRNIYSEFTLTIDGKDFYDDFKGTGGIRGRGNSSWSFPKKPYRVKLDEETPLLGLAAYRDWILLAEYLDGTLLYNSIAYKTGELLGLPYTNQIIPVDVTINGEYRGVYAFTEHKEVGPNRIDIGNDGWLLEMDTDMDEDWVFYSKGIELPVMIQYPKSKDMTEELFNTIKTEFETMEELIFSESFPNNNYLDYLDALSFVDYLIVYQLTLNKEINIPRSTYINKLSGGKFRMGIIWDFDWGFGYHLDKQHYSPATATASLFDSQKPGRLFFDKVLQDPHIKELYKERWEWFRSNAFEQVKQNVREYSAKISPSQPKDHKIWGERGSSGNNKDDLKRVLDWLDARAEYLDRYANEL